MDIDELKRRSGIQENAEISEATDLLGTIAEALSDYGTSGWKIAVRKNSIAAKNLHSGQIYNIVVLDESMKPFRIDNEVVAYKKSL